MLSRILATVRRFLDAVLPSPPDEDAGPPTDAESARRRLRIRLFEKQGKGGFR